VLVPHYSFYTGAGIIDGRDSAAILVAAVAAEAAEAAEAKLVAAEAAEAKLVAAEAAVATLVRICNTNSVTLASDISKINENNRHVRRI
jgi:hypothetical protein